MADGLNRFTRFYETILNLETNTCNALIHQYFYPSLVKDLEKFLFYSNSDSLKNQQDNTEIKVFWLSTSTGLTVALPANLSCGEDESVTQIVISVDFSVAERLLKTCNQELEGGVNKPTHRQLLHDIINGQ